MRLYVHGSGRSGAAAWPQQVAEDAHFAELPAAATLAERIEILAANEPTSDYTLVAHSAGAIPAVLAVGTARITPTRVVLVEPALYDIARGDPAIERHIATVTQALAHAAEGDLWGYWQLIRPLMFGGPADEQNWDAERPRAERFSAIDPPWGPDVTAAMIDSVETLVVTGGWNAEYEAIAAILVEHGAEHRQVVGAEHRPQDLPEFAEVLGEFEAR